MGILNLEAHRLALAIAKKTLDENCFRTAQKTTDRQPPSFKTGDRVYFKNKQPTKWDLKWIPGYRIVQIECNGHFLHIENQATRKVQSCNVKDVVLEPPIEFWNIDTNLAELENMSTILQIYLLYLFMINCKQLICTQITVNNPALILLTAFYT